ncbi:MAG: hypothetical protein DK306_001995 [Chloroflexi bacterium]|jgi:hypothetical protein|nr:MAG: hypothetical protein DK306_001995 [Chloroflexota bacterium]
MRPLGRGDVEDDAALTSIVGVQVGEAAVSGGYGDTAAHVTQRGRFDLDDFGTERLP